MFEDLIIREKEYNAPTPGLQDAVCCGFWPIGIQKIEWKGEVKRKNQVIIGFELAEENPDTGDRFLQFERYSLFIGSLKSKLRQHLESWFARSLTEEEIKAFSLLSLVGKQCQLNLKANGSWRNVDTILPESPSKKLTPIDVLKGEAPRYVLAMREKAEPEVPF